MRGTWSLKVLGVVLGLSIVAACDEPPYIPDKESDTTSSCIVQPTLTSLKDNYFKQSCVLTSCHLEGPVTRNGGLDLNMAGLHDRLVGVTPHNAQAAREGKVLVMAGDPDSSFIVQKVEGNLDKQVSSQDVREGKWMPDGTNKVIDPECRVKMLRQWIADGAKDN